MAHWPPQPCVEDEVTSLEHEQMTPKMAEELKSDDDPAVSRGAVDQYPILVDTDDSRAANKKTPKGGIAGNKPSEINSSDDSAGPTTPPALSRRRTDRYSPSGHPRGVPTAGNASTVPAGVQNDNGRGRPQVTRIDTSLGADLQSMLTGTRRAPSPYSYSRPLGKSAGSGDRPFTMSSASDKQTTPIQTPSEPVHFSPHSSADARAVLSDEPDVVGRERRRHRSKSRARSRSHPREPSSRRDRRASRRKFSDSSSDDDDQVSHHRSRKGSTNTASSTPSRRYESQRESFTPPYSRRQSKETYYVSGGDENSIRASRYGTQDKRPFEQPYSSLSQDQSNGLHARNERNRDLQDEQRQKSTSRRERPQLGSFPEHIRSRRPLNSSADDTAIPNRENNRRSHLNPPTPLTADAAKSMEDYFERAFRENETRQQIYRRNYRGGGSAVASPLTSPPRTPKSERQSRDYFEIDPTLARGMQRSRPPSMDDGQLSALKSHASLLSAATVGAAIAARGTPEQTTSTRTGSTPRSRKPSPVLEEYNGQSRPGATFQAENFRSGPGIAQLADRPPNSRSSVHDSEPTQMFPPKRSVSYSGYDQPKGILKPTSAYPYLPSVNARGPTPGSQPIGPYLQQEGILRLPSCPRPNPVAGYRDWTSIKEMSHLDICPTCTSVLRTTHFGHLLVPSLPRPYNEPSVCAMSKPWLRIAFLRAYRQGSSDLDGLKTLSTLPTDTKPCKGEKFDTRMWFHITDPSTQNVLPNFVACSACVRAVDTIFPELRHLLDRSMKASTQAKVCGLHAGSQHFSTLVDQFEQAATRCRGRRWRPSDVQPLVNYIRKLTRVQECCRDKLLSTRVWHFMPDLPEFTICEDCYDDVVLPVSDQPFARDVSQIAKTVPVRRNSTGNSGISCQLYSERMRKMFRDAIATRTFTPLCEAAKTRQAAQLRLHEMNKLYEADQRYGIDRREEIGKNMAIWQTLE